MMAEIKEVGQRGVIFQYEDQNLVYLLKGDRRLYLCDTHLGPASMEIVKEYINNRGLDRKDLVIFNSHSDYDHNWGNCAFANNLIVAQSANLTRFKKRAEYDLEMKSRFKQGEVKLVAPNLLFADKLHFADDEVEFIHLPGHTSDSAICLDHQDSAVYVGDLVEAPIPIVLWDDLKEYIQSLEYLKALSVERYIASHSGLVEEKEITENIDYLKKLARGKPVVFGEEGLNRVHEFNRKNLLMQKFESTARKKLGDKFAFKKFKEDFWQEMGSSYDDLTNEFNYIVETDKEKLSRAFNNYLEKKLKRGNIS